MGFIGLPVSVFLFWLMMRPKKDDPFPKGGFRRLVIAAAVSVVISVVLTFPISAILLLFRIGVFSDLDGWIQISHESPQAIVEAVKDAVSRTEPSFFDNLAGMFLSAGLLEEGLKFLTCRIAIRKKGMVRTWMDSVTAFAIVGIAFELIENIAFGQNSDLLSAAVRALAPAHFIFGVIMGYFYGKYLVTGRKRYCLLSLGLPAIYHTLTNTLAVSMTLNDTFRSLGIVSGIHYMFAGVITVCIILYWQKHRTLNIPVRQSGASKAAYSFDHKNYVVPPHGSEV